MLPIANQIQLIGRAGHAPDLEYMTDGTPRVSLRLYQDRSGHTCHEPQVHQLLAWNAVARQLHQRVGRGATVLVQGRLQYRRSTYRGTTQLRAEIHVACFTVLNNRTRTTRAESTEVHPMPFTNE